MEDNKLDYKVSHNLPLPMKDDATYNEIIELAISLEKGPLSKVEQEYGLTYRQAIWELIYTMATCRLDISFTWIKFSQYSADPGREYFTAV